MKWQFILTDNLGSEGTITCDMDPVGWADIEIDLVRDKTYRGVFGNVTDTLSFVGNSYDFLKSTFEIYGAEADVTIQVNVAGDDTAAFEQFFIGQVSFPDIEFDEGSVCMAKANLLEFGALSVLQRRADQKVDLMTLQAFSQDISLPAYDGLNLPVVLEPKAIELSSDITNEIFQQDVSGPFNEFAAGPVVIGIGNQDVDYSSYYWAASSVKVLGLDTVLGQNLPDVGIYAQGQQDNSASDCPALVTANLAGLYKVTITNNDNVASIENAIVMAAHTNALLTSTGNPGGFDEFIVNLQVQFVIAGVPHLKTIWTADSGPANAWATGSMVGFYGGFPGQVLPSEFGLVLGDQAYDPGSMKPVYAYLNPGDTIQVWIQVYQKGNYTQGLSSNPVYFDQYVACSYDVTVDVKSYAPVSISPYFMINEVFSRIVESVTDGQMKVISDYFGRTDSMPYQADEDGPGSLLGLTTGLFLRNALGKDSLGNYVLPPKLQLSFKDVFDAMNSLHNIGFGLEPDIDRAGGKYQRVRIEPIEYFYSSTVILVCDKIMDVQINSRPDELCSSFKNGYEKFEAEKYTGLDEFNAGHEYRTNMKQTDATLDRTCKFIASGYCMEITRQMSFIPNMAQDWRLDNDVFVTCMKRSVNSGGDYYDPKYPAEPDALGIAPSVGGRDIAGSPVPTSLIYPYPATISPPIIVEQGDGSADYPASLTGSGNLIDPPSVYNLRISPLRNLLRWCKTLLQAYSSSQLLSSGFISGWLSKATGNYFAFGFITNDYIVWGGEIPYEYQNITEALVNAHDSLKPIVKPQLITFDYPLKLKEWYLLNANPNGTIQARWGQNADYVNCFIDEVNYKPNTGIATFKLIPAWG